MLMYACDRFAFIADVSCVYVCVCVCSRARVCVCTRALVQLYMS